LNNLGFTSSSLFNQDLALDRIVSTKELQEDPNRVTLTGLKLFEIHGASKAILEPV